MKPEEEPDYPPLFKDSLYISLISVHLTLIFILLAILRGVFGIVNEPFLTDLFKHFVWNCVFVYIPYIICGICACICMEIYQISHTWMRRYAETFTYIFIDLLYIALMAIAIVTYIQNT